VLELRKITSCILLVLLLLCAVTISVSADNRDLLVYIASGSSTAYRYHARANCPSLSSSVVAELTLEEAAQRGFTACSRCHPPQPDFEVKVTPRPVTPGGGWGGTYIRPTASPRPAAESKEKSSSVPFRFNIPLAIVCALVIYAFVVHRTLKKEEEKQRLEQEKQRRLKEAEEKAKQERIAVEDKPRAEKAQEEAQRYFAEQKREAEEHRKEQHRKRREAWEKKKQEYEKEYSDRTTLECSGAPSGCAVGDDGLPYDDTRIKYWGTAYTFYRTPSGKTYHTYKCRYAKSSSAMPINAYNALRSGLYSCAICCPKLPDLTWYAKYLEIKSIRKKYGIPEPARESEEDILNEMFIEVHR